MCPGQDADADQDTPPELPEHCASRVVPSRRAALAPVFWGGGGGELGMEGARYPFMSMAVQIRGGQQR